MAGFVTLLIVLALALYVCWLMLQPFSNVLLWAGVLAIVFYPMHRRILTRTGRPTPAAAISTLLVVVLILIPVTFISVAVVHELAGATTNLQAGVDRLSQITVPMANWIPERFRGRLAFDRDATWAFISERMQTWGAVVASSTLMVVGGAVGAIVQIVIVVFTLFYLFRDGDRLRQKVYELMPLERSQMHEIAARTQEVIAATIYGVLVIAAVQGTLGTFIFWILGLPSPLLWGVIMFFVAMIPMAGTFLVWAPAAVYLLLTGAFIRAAILVGWGLLVIGTIDNFLSPRLVGHRARLHELLIFFGVLGGLQVFGVLGLVLGPVVVAITLALIEMAHAALRPLR
jgi:predicted PurR-regulated permease PerM